MDLIFADQWLPQSFIQGLAWTLVHSLWQGFIVALIALVMLGFTRRSSPILRYNLLLLLLVLFVVTFTLTFCFQYHSTQRELSKESRLSQLVTNEPFSQNQDSFILIQKTKDYLSTVKNTFNKHVNLIITLWFFIVCIQYLRLCYSIGYIYRIRHYKTYVPSSIWIDRCAEFKIKMGIQKQVALLESAIIKVPLVVGFVKPLILLPVGLLANIPYSQVESILLHELAHIKRRDYMVNLVQSLIETIFFFNPAILWISSLIKEEREACCDEIAVKCLNSKYQYIEALVSFQEFALKASGYVMAFPGRKNQLLQRIKRIVNNENNKLNYMEKSIVFLGIVALIVITVLSTHEVKAQKNTVSNSVNTNIDSVPNKIVKNTAKIPIEKKPTRTRVTTNNNGKDKTVELEVSGSGRNLNATLKNNNIIKLSINGKELPEAEFKKYEQEVRSIIDEN